MKKKTIPRPVRLMSNGLRWQVQVAGTTVDVLGRSRTYWRALPLECLAGGSPVYSTADGRLARQRYVAECRRAGIPPLRVDSDE